MIEILLATRNKNKVFEIQQIFSEQPVFFNSLSAFPKAPDVLEDGYSFLENAIKKARAIASWSGKISLADDSGLEVDCLSGAPGIYSARFAGEKANDEENNQKLLELLRNVPFNQRTAHYRCIMAIAYPDGQVETSEGICEGLIALKPSGRNGFGYDPLFFYPPLNKTFGEIDPSIKNKISHRFYALKNITPALLKLLRS